MASHYTKHKLIIYGLLNKLLTHGRVGIFGNNKIAFTNESRADLI
jgi:hypothetical protein